MAGFRAVTVDFIPEAAQYVNTPLLIIPLYLRTFDSAVTGWRTIFVFPLNWCIVSMCLISWFARRSGEKNNCTLDYHSKTTGSRQSSAMKPSLWDEGLDLPLSFPWTASLEEGNQQNSARNEEAERNDPRWVASHNSWKMYDIWLETCACSWIFWGLK